MHMPINSDLQQRNPTGELYESIQLAFEFMNEELFDGCLPNCLITLQRRRSSYGYFAAQRFVSREQKHYCDEIALNPLHFSQRPILEILATLGHEMCHLYQQHFGNPGRGRYHNKEWASIMKNIGLQPTATGSKGGKETGDRVSQLIVDTGPFDDCARRLIEGGFAIHWHEQLTGILNEAADGQEIPKDKNGKRVKYSCPSCALNVWARHGAKIDCHAHGLLLLPSK